MQMIQSGYRGLSLVFDLSIDRILIPLAIVVGLAGGAMIGSEIAKLQVPPSQFMR
jgi:predicted ABC-type sugar transport system permease subunit